MLGRLFVPVLALLLACNGDTTADAGTTDTGDGPTTGAVPTTGAAPTTGADLCGNGLLDDGEDCDGVLLGGRICADVDPARPNGPLACASDCAFDTSGCFFGGRVVLNELTSFGTDVGPYAGLGDAIELYNHGDAPFDLSGWMLSDEPDLSDGSTYVFLEGTTLAPAEFLVLTRANLTFGLNNEEIVLLADRDGVEVDKVSFGGTDARVSYCRVPDGDGPWRRCDATFGAANLASTIVCGNGARETGEPCEGADLGGADCAALGFTGGTLTCTTACTLETGTCTAVSPVILNELEATEDLIEILNSGDTPVDISGWILTDDPIGPDYDPNMDLEKLVFPPQSILDADSYVILSKGELPHQHPFGLNLGGDTVTLLQIDLTLVDQISYGPDLATVSFCRLPDGPGNPWTADCIPTFGAPNLQP
jgi:hypothetical protein